MSNNSRRYHIGELEEFILLTVAFMDSDQYALKVKEVFESKSKRKVNISAIHSALYRMEDKGYLSSHISEPAKMRGGKGRRIFQITQSGLEILQTNKEIRDEYWKGLSDLAFN